MSVCSGMQRRRLSHSNKAEEANCSKTHCFGGEHSIAYHSIADHSMADPFGVEVGMAAGKEGVL